MTKPIRTEIAANEIRALTERGEPIVVLIGAGVSTEVGVPTGSKIIEEVYDEFGKREIQAGLLKKHHWRFFPVMASLKSILAEKDADSTRFNELLQKWFGNGETNSLKQKTISESYELLAHQLHYNKLTAIVSLNFDEHLDEAILLESQCTARAGQLVRCPIASISEFSSFEEVLLERNSVKKIRGPIYLKPHGTISRPATLRFSPGDIWNLEPEKERVLEKLFSGATVLALGWSQGDPDLAYTLRNAKRVLCVSRTVNEDDCLGGEQTNSVESDALSFLRLVMKPRDDDTKGAQKWKGAIRHQIRGAFLGIGAVGSDSSCPTEPLLSATTLNQLALELLIHFVKARGQVVFSTIFDCPRVRYLARKLPDGKGVNKLLQRFVDDGIVSADISGTGEPVYSFRNDDMDSWQDATERLQHSIRAAVDGWLKSMQIDQEPAARGRELLLGLGSSFDIDVRYDQAVLERFSTATAIVSRREFKKVSKTLITSTQSNNCLWISTYTGEWLLDYFDEIRASRIVLVVDDFFAYRDRPSHIYGGFAQHQVERVYRALSSADSGKQIEVRVLQNKVHNMSIVTNDTTNAIKRAIYFDRRDKTPNVSPVLLSKPNKHDQTQLRNYWEILIEQSVELKSRIDSAGEFVGFVRGDG